MSRQTFLDRVNVSRETIARLDVYAALLSKWQARINLVSNKSLPDMWQRHFLDSAQLHPLLPANAVVADLGSGAGFPGLVLAILGGVTVHLIESDTRKAAFLREAIRVTEAPAVLYETRIEAGPRIDCDIVTARALAPLNKLLELAKPYVSENTRCLFLKGNRFTEELTIANQSWHIVCQTLPSRTDDTGCIVSIDSFHRR